jgi:hypothetical protein
MADNDINAELRSTRPEPTGEMTSGIIEALNHLDGVIEAISSVGGATNNQKLLNALAHAGTFVGKLGEALCDAGDIANTLEEGRG